MKPNAHFNKDISENSMCSSTKKLHADVFSKRFEFMPAKKP